MFDEVSDTASIISDPPETPKKASKGMPKSTPKGASAEVGRGKATVTKSSAVKTFTAEEG